MDIERLSMIELIEKVIVNRIDYDENANEKSLQEMLVSASEIADRLDITVESACALAWVVYESSWGRQVDRQFLMSKFHEGSSIELRFRSLWILTKRRLVRTFRYRSPTLMYYMDKDQCERVLSGNLESLFNDRLINENENRRITAQSCAGGDDYNLFLDGVPQGYIFESTTIGYEVYWLGVLILEHNHIETILETLNEMLEQNRLPQSQK